MTAKHSLIILDRDGVLNRAFVEAATGRILSPLSLAEVEVFSEVPTALARLTKAGYTTVVATNQPGAAKGEASKEALEAVHHLVLSQAQSAGGIISHSYICYHRAEDNCPCRKPKPGLLEEALNAHPSCSREHSWMVGDRATDVLAGAAAGLCTALLGSTLPLALAQLNKQGVVPKYFGPNFGDFVNFLLLRSGDVFGPLAARSY